MNRRSFLKLLGATVTVVATSSVLDLIDNMAVLYGDGVVDDTKALQSLFNGDKVKLTDGTVIEMTKGYINELIIPKGTFKVSDTISIRPRNATILNGNGANFSAIHDKSIIQIDCKQDTPLTVCNFHLESVNGSCESGFNFTNS